MTVVPQSEGGALAPRGGGGGSGNLYDVLELVLDRGLVIDAFVRVSLVGIEILKIDARVVVASVDTYLRFAEACNRLDLESGRKAPSQLTDIVGDTTESGARGKRKGAMVGITLIRISPDSGLPLDCTSSESSSVSRRMRCALATTALPSGVKRTARFVRSTSVTSSSVSRSRRPAERVDCDTKQASAALPK